MHARFLDWVTRPLQQLSETALRLIYHCHPKSQAIFATSARLVGTKLCTDCMDAGQTNPTNLILFPNGSTAPPKASWPLGCLQQGGSEGSYALEPTKYFAEERHSSGSETSEALPFYGMPMFRSKAAGV